MNSSPLPTFEPDVVPRATALEGVAAADGTSEPGALTRSQSMPRRNTKAIIDFTQREQELAMVVRRSSNGSIIDPADAAKFSLELRNFHNFSQDAVLKHFNSNLYDGISKNEVQLRRLAHGPNIMAKSSEIPVWAKFCLSFVSGFSPLIWFACFVVFLAWKPFGTPPSDIYNLALAIALLIVIFLSGIFNFYQEMQTTQMLTAFSNMIPPLCLVTRAGQPTQIRPEDLVVGDIVHLQTGYGVPADLRILTQTGLKVDKSMLTGENEAVRLISDIVSADTPMLQACNMAFMGCNVVEGEGVGVVVAIGHDTQLSKIAAHMDSVSHTTTSLQRDLNRFVVIIGTFSMLTAAVVIMVWAFYLRVDHDGFMTTSSMIANAISVVVAYVPEGLPLALSMGLSIIASRLCVQHQVLVKQLSTIETLGSMSVLASDKTGTLTLNDMTVTTVITSKGSYSGDLITSLHPGLQQVILTVSVFCNQCRIKDGKFNRNQDVKEQLIGGNGIDKALLKWWLAIDPSGDKILSLLKQGITLVSMPFSSSHKLAAAVIQGPKVLGTARTVLVKGAPEYILQRCNRYLNSVGEVCDINNEVLRIINKGIADQADRGERVVALAVTTISDTSFKPTFVFRCDPEPNFPVTDLIFACCLAVSDPPRPGVREAVQTLRNAGITIALITGDASATAQSIAMQVSIIEDKSAPIDVYTDSTVLSPGLSSRGEGGGGGGGGEGDVELGVYTHHEGHHSGNHSVVPYSSFAAPRSKTVVVEGKYLDTITGAGWDYIFLHSELIFARTTPEHKLFIVQEFQRRGKRVGVTGDGVNDSPALKAADIGIAMAAGSDVARDAAVMVLLNNDFSAVVKGVEEGRLIFLNLRKVIGYQIAAGCWSELIPVLATFFVGMPQPLSSFLMIIISCMTDVCAGIALTCEVPEKSLMLLPPRDPLKEPLADFTLIAYAYFFYGTLQSLASFILYFIYMYNRGPVNMVPTPVPLDDDGSRSFPAGYAPKQLVGAWNWGLNSGDMGADQVAASATASSVFFVMLTVSQWGHLISIRRKTPYFCDSILDREGKGGHVMNRMREELMQSAPRRPIVLAIIASALIVNFFNEVPAVQESCGTAHVPAVYWGLAIAFSVVIFLVAEVRKWLILLYPAQFGRFQW